MLSKLFNTPMAYPWGSDHLLQDLMGLHDTAIAAEFWFGIHPNSPATLSNGQPLAEIAPELSFMVKFLAAAKPLSIQVHPNLEQAKSGFASRVAGYQDANHKPEMLIAVSSFRALSGFRNLVDVQTDIGKLVAVDHRFAAWLDASVSLSGCFDYIQTDLDADDIARLAEISTDALFPTLHSEYPGDSGIAIALMLNQIELRPGEALFLPAGNLHCYLEGLAVEVMANSDNVLRAGLTVKQTHPVQLRDVVVFESLNPMVTPKLLQRGLLEYPVEVEDFKVYQLQPSASVMMADLELPGDSVVVCVAGELAISTSLDEMAVLHPGDAYFVSQARLISIAGSGTGYLATGN